MSYAGTFEAGVTPPLDSLTGNAGGVVFPDGASNIDILGSGIVTVTGTPASNLLTISITDPVPVANGGTGAATLTDHGLLVGSGTAAVTILGAATDGQLPIGSTGADPVLANITSSGATVTITNGAGTINLETGGAVAVQFDGDSGSAVPALGVITMAGGTNITTAAAGSTVTFNLDAAISGTTSHDFAAGGRIGTATSAGNTLLIQAYDVDGAVYTTFATLTANNTPTMDLDDAVTKAGQYIYRAAGTDVPVTDGGTGASTLTDHGVLVGSGTAAVTALTVGTDGQVLLGSSAADPVFATLTSTGSTIAFTPGAGSLNLETGSAVCVSAPTDSGTATPSSGALTFAGGTNINTAGAAATVTINLDAAISGTTSHDFAAGGRIGTATSAGNTLLIQAYDVDGAVYTTFATLTANNTPTMDLDDAVTKAGNYIYRAGGTDIPVTDGGTGASAITDHSLIVGSGTGAVTELGSATDGQLPIGSTGADPVLAAITGGTGIDVTNGAGTISLATDSATANSFPTDSGTATPSSGALTVAGGTNLNTAGAGSTVTVNLDASIASMTAVDFATGGRLGTATSAGNTALIQAYDVDGASYTTFATLTANNTPTMDLDDAVTKSGQYIYRAAGTDVPVTDGGTGVSTLTDHGIVLGSGAGAVTVLAEASDGQIPIGSTGNDPVLATITAGSGINVTNAAGSITVTNTGIAISWLEATGATQAMAVNTGYTTNNGAQLDYTLPATAAVGDIVAVVGNSANGWTISQNAGQTVHYISLDTTTGAGGSLTSTNRYDCIELVCITANTDFVARSSCGNINVI